MKALRQDVAVLAFHPLLPACGVSPMPLVGNPEVADKQFYGENIDEALGYLASVERESDHPLAQAVLDDIGKTTISPVEAP